MHPQKDYNSPRFNSIQKCERCHIKFIWNPQLSQGGFIISDETLKKHGVANTNLTVKRYFFCNECYAKWKKFKPERYSYTAYIEYLAKFLRYKDLKFMFR